MATKSKPQSAEPRQLAVGELTKCEKRILSYLAMTRTSFWALKPNPTKEECRAFNAALDRAKALLSARANQAGRTE